MFSQPDANVYTMQGFAQQQSQPQMQMMHNGVNAYAGQRFRGTVKSYSENNGYGFIGGEEITHQLGKDVFLHQRDITEATGIPRPQIPAGVAVTFAVTINPKCQPQAREIQFEDTSFLQMQQMGGQVTGLNPMGGTNTHSGGMVYNYVENGRRFKGFVRSFSNQNGFGFVGGDEISSMFGKDVFLHFRELSSVIQTNPANPLEKPSVPGGTWMSFTVTLNQKGQPQARDVQLEPVQQLTPQEMATQPSPQGYVQMNNVNGGQQQQQGGQMQIQDQMPSNNGFSQAPNYPPPMQQQSMNPGQGGMQGRDMTPGGLTVSDAEAYARVQADIEKFQREVQEQQKGSFDGGEDRRRDSEVKKERNRSRSPRRWD